MRLFTKDNYMVSLREKVGKKLSHGGSWLGAVRSWIQWHVTNGEHVAWGSNDVLGGFSDRCDSHKAFTVKELEDIATKVAEAAYYDAYSTLKYEMRHAALEYELHMQDEEAKKIREAVKLLFGE